MGGTSKSIQPVRLLARGEWVGLSGSAHCWVLREHPGPSSPQGGRRAVVDSAPGLPAEFITGAPGCRLVGRVVGGGCRGVIVICTVDAGLFLAKFFRPHGARR